MKHQKISYKNVGVKINGSVSGKSIIVASIDTVLVHNVNVLSKQTGLPQSEVVAMLLNSAMLSLHDGQSWLVKNGRFYDVEFQTCDCPDNA